MNRQAQVCAKYPWHLTPSTAVCFLGMCILAVCFLTVSATKVAE